MNLNRPYTLTALILSIPALAMAGIATGDTVSIDEAEIRAQFESDGYEILEIEVEDDEIEVEVLKDGIETEFVLSAATGIVQEIETDDDDDDGDDDESEAPDSDGQN